MYVKQNVIDLKSEYSEGAKQVERPFYVDDYLGGADTVEDAVKLYQDLHNLFGRGGFLLRKWSSSDQLILESIPDHLKNSQALILHRCCPLH